MSDFPFIQSLQAETDKTPLPKGHNYVEYEAIVEGETVKVHIPKTEIETFKIKLSENETMNKYSFNKIMREVRGIRG